MAGETASVGSQSPQPHLEDHSTYYPRRPTKLDKIKNRHPEVQAKAVADVLGSVACLETIYDCGVEVCIDALQRQPSNEG